MAFRITYQGAVIEADTASDVQQLLLALAEPLAQPRLLPPPPADFVDELHKHTRPVRMPRRRAIRQAPRRRHGGGRQSSPAPTPPASAVAKPGRQPVADRQARILELLDAGPLKPGDLARKLGVAPITCRVLVAPLLKSGAVRAEGTTMSRRLMLGSRRPAKEGL